MDSCGKFLHSRRDTYRVWRKDPIIAGGPETGLGTYDENDEESEHRPEQAEQLIQRLNTNMSSGISAGWLIVVWRLHTEYSHIVFIHIHAHIISLYCSICFTLKREAPYGKTETIGTPRNSRFNRIPHTSHTSGFSTALSLLLSPLLDCRAIFLVERYVARAGKKIPGWMKVWMRAARPIMLIN